MFLRCRDLKMKVFCKNSLPLFTSFLGNHFHLFSTRKQIRIGHFLFLFCSVLFCSVLFTFIKMFIVEVNFWFCTPGSKARNLLNYKNYQHHQPTQQREGLTKYANLEYFIFIKKFLLSPFPDPRGDGVLG